MEKSLKIPVSFKRNEVEIKIYKYIQKQLNYSLYIKQLVLKDMEEKGVKLEINNNLMNISSINNKSISMDKPLKIPISFKRNEIEIKIYDYIKKQFNCSLYIKQLVLKDMDEKGIGLEINNKPISMNSNKSINLSSNNIDF